MAGIVLGIGETNPKKGAVQYDARRIDGLQLKFPADAVVTKAPVGSIVTIQEHPTTGKQVAVLGAADYEPDVYTTYKRIGIGFLEAATQQSGSINPVPGEFSEDDFVSVISDTTVVAQVPYKTGEKPNTGISAFVTPDGELSSQNSGNTALPGVVFYGTPGVQSAGQLKSGYAFVRLIVAIQTA